MSLSSFFLGALACAFVSRVALAEPLKPLIATRNAPGTSSLDTVRAISRGLSSMQLHGRDTVVKNTTVLDKSWNGAVLFQFQDEGTASGAVGDASAQASVEIVCTTCYIKGNATAELNIAGNFSVGQVFQNLTDDASLVATEIKNITEEAIQATEDYFEAILQNLTTGSFNFKDLDDLDFPTIDFDFNIDAIPDIPEVMLRFSFDGLELYMGLDANLDLNATYALSLYTSESPIGLGAGDDLSIGVIVDIDLILTVNSKIDISSGFHIKLNDGAAIEIAMFGKNVSNIAFNGGQFEFLPVTVEAAGAVMSALLRVGLHAGIEVGEPGFKLPGPLSILKVPSASAGMEVGVFAHLANFVTNITAAGPDDTDGCPLKVVEYYELALGAAAGATLAIGTHTWGPNPQTTLPVFFTTLPENCASQKTAAPNATVASATQTIAPRQAAALTTTTLTTSVTFSAVGCMTTGLANCPVSLQTTSKVTTASTLVVSVPSGVVATFPPTTQAAVATTVPFGTRVNDLLSSAGIPISYTPPPPLTSLFPPSNGSSHNGSFFGSNGTLSDFSKGETAGIPNAAIIGASVGGGVALLIALLCGCRCWRRKKYAPLDPPYQRSQKQAVTVTVV